MGGWPLQRLYIGARATSLALSSMLRRDVYASVFLILVSHPACRQARPLSIPHRLNNYHIYIWCGVWYIEVLGGCFKSDLYHGMQHMKVKKLTVEVPSDLLERATTATGQGITPTIRRGLELVAASGAYANLRKRRGRVKFSIKLSELRED